ncbi:MAG: hypothetical protein EOO38_11275 [Cytophagaceae bacterium]|nr:MAG: hypothetical protein EOO38_11275 [Cytophagaceae bacterium]
MHTRVSSRVLRRLNEAEQTDGKAFFVSGNEVVPGNASTRAHSAGASSDGRFSFEAVHGEDVSNEGLYQATVEPLLSQFLEGLNVTVMAYGQTGSGKTYTIGSNYTGETSDESTGVIVRVVDRLLEQLDAQYDASARGMTGTAPGGGDMVVDDACSASGSSSSIDAPTKATPTPSGASDACAPSYKLSATFVELYNEKLRDLLLPDSVPEPAGGFSLFKDQFGNYLPKGVTEVPIANMHDLQAREKLVVGSNCKVALVDRTPVKIDGTMVSSAIFSRLARVKISPDCRQSRLSDIATGLELHNLRASRCSLCLCAP